jgi:hypothetical protein
MRCFGYLRVGRRNVVHNSRGEVNMERYANLGGNSGIVGYEIGDDFVRVQFSGGSIYLYTYSSAGSNNIEQMKKLARNGQGLNAFINRNVRKAYARKER